jgi:hypothetical protein
MEEVGTGKSRDHVLARHVGLTDAQLRQRLADQPKVGAASTFKSETAAQDFVQDAINSHQNEIDQWLSKQPPDDPTEGWIYTPPGGDVVTGTMWPRGGP